MNNHNLRPPSPSHLNRESHNSPSPTTFDLEQIFSHPAGLRVARKVTESLIAQRPLFGTNPDVMERLGDILILSEAYTRDCSSAPGSGTGGTMTDRHYTQNGEPSRTSDHPNTSRNMPVRSWMDSGRALPQPQWNNSRPSIQANPSSQPPFYNSNSMVKDTFLPPIRESTGQSAFTSQRHRTEPSYPQYQGAFQSNEGGNSRNGSPFSHYNSVQASFSRTPSGNYSRGSAQLSNSPSRGGAPPSRIQSASPQIQSKNSSSQHAPSVNKTSEQDAASKGGASANNDSNSAVEVSNSSLPPGQQSHIFVNFNFINANSKVQIERQGKRGAPDHEGAVAKKKAKARAAPSKRTKAKEVDPNSAVNRVTAEIWMRILEFAPPGFLNKARLVCKNFHGIVERYQTSLFVNCRQENGIPPPPPGISEKQLNSLLGGFKGCQEEGCADKMAHRTHWSFMKRLCHRCWQNKIMREDKILKSHASPPRVTLLRLLECIPVAIQDSFLKAHDYKDDLEAARGQPRLYKVYSEQDVKRVIDEYENLGPGEFVTDPALTQAENDAAQREIERRLADLPAKQEAYLTDGKAKNDDHMAYVKTVEQILKTKRAKNKVEIDLHRNSRKELFTKRAEEDLPAIPKEFVQRTKAFKAACRIFRNGGSERGWQQLKPKIQSEWDESQRSGAQAPPTEQKDSQIDEPAENDADNVDEDPTRDNNDQHAYLDDNYAHIQPGSFNDISGSGNSRTQTGSFNNALAGGNLQSQRGSFNSGLHTNNFQISGLFHGRLNNNYSQSQSGSLTGMDFGLNSSGPGLGQIYSSHSMLGHNSSPHRQQRPSASNGQHLSFNSSSTSNGYVAPSQASGSNNASLDIRSLLNPLESTEHQQSSSQYRGH